jgi:hypothetical protein
MNSRDTDDTAPAATGEERELPASSTFWTKERREWLQFGLNLAAACAAVLLFFGYDSQNRVLSNQIAAIKKDIDKLVLERTRIELDDLKGRKLQITKSLKSTAMVRDNKRSHKIEFQYSFANRGSTSFEISNALIEFYVGKLPAGATKAVVINSPLEPGAVTWQNVLRRAHFADARFRPGAFIESHDLSANPRQIVGIAGGGGTGTAAQGETLEDGIAIVTPAGEADLVAVIVTITVDQSIGRTFGMIEAAEARVDVTEVLH